MVTSFNRHRIRYYAAGAVVMLAAAMFWASLGATDSVSFVAGASLATAIDRWLFHGSGERG